MEPNFKITSSLGCFVFTPFRSIMHVSYFTRKNEIDLPKQKEISATAAPLYTTVGCCCVSVRVHYQPPACAFYGIFKTASHLNALDSIKDEISPVCSGQSLKGPLKTRMPSHPQCGLNNKNRKGGWVDAGITNNVDKNTNRVVSQPLIPVRMSHSLVVGKR